MRIAPCLFVAAACGAPVRAPMNEKHAESPTSRPCPPDLAQRLRGDDARGKELLACLAGKFPRPGWAAAYRTEGVDGMVGLAIIDGARIVTAEIAAMSFGPLDVADLDGDGADELIAATEASALFGDDSHQTRRIVALKLRGDELSELGDALAFGTVKQYSSGELSYECTATHAFERDPGSGMRLVVTVEPEVGHRDDQACPSPGRHTYRVANAKLVEVK